MRDLTYQKCQQLVSFPNMGRQYEDLRPSLRGLPLDGYIIFYIITGQGIEIFRVVSGRRKVISEKENTCAGEFRLRSTLDLSVG
ncbi:MAG: type II toxin-antitoxin system RelE/ParE family toxin [Nostoc sp.]|uniref:type II toxin-antitoxin system RelE/ParE family toxin n=1 Tax=Nostoc sp. TaxID=1180 RepID=UPI002FF6324E